MAEKNVLPNAAMPSTSREEQRLAGRTWRYQPGAGPNDAANNIEATKRTIPPYNAADFKRALVFEVNRWRSSPATIVSELEALLASTTAWDGDKRFAHPESRSLTKITMKEGKAAVRDAIAYFKDLDARKPFEENPLLENIAERLAKDRTASVDARLKAENAEAQFGNMVDVAIEGELSAQETVFLWMIGDGDGNRQIRKQLCSSLYKQCGVASTKPATSSRQNVLSLAVCVTAAGQLPAREVFGRKGAHIEEASLANANLQPAPAAAATTTTTATPAASTATATTRNAFCGNCGRKALPNEKFCGGCGTRL